VVERLPGKSKSIMREQTTQKMSKKFNTYFTELTHKWLLNTGKALNAIRHSEMKI
jgi:hypothetical protein